MIRKIDLIKNVQTFCDFSWPELETFKKYNLIFGENGSGKTALSRIFKSIEENSSLDKWVTYGSIPKDISIKIKFEDESVEYNDNIWKNRGNKKIHVFNRDFINENFLENIKEFDCDDSDIDVSIKGLVGKEKILLDKKTKELEKLNIDVQSTTKELEDIINNSLKENDFFKTKGKNIATENINIENVKVEKVRDIKILEEKIAANKKNYLLLKDIESDDSLIINMDYDNVLIEKIEKVKFINSKDNILIFKSLSNDKLIDEYLVKKNFVLEGMKILDKKENLCPFCEQKLNESAKKLLKDYKKFIESKNILAFDCLDKILNTLESVKISEFSGLLMVVEKYESMISKSIIKKGLKFSLIDKVNNVITLIKETIDSKKSDLSLDISNEIENLIDELIILFNELQLACDMYDEINKMKDLATKECKNCRINANEYLRQKIRVLNNGKLKKLEKLEKEQKSCEKELEKITIEYDILLKNTNAQSATMNKILKNIGLGEFEINQDLELVHRRNLTKASKLSEGEKGIIAFTFFIGKLRGLYNKSKNLDNLIIVIDDPVDSTSNVFFERIFAMIKRLNNIINSQDKSYAQLFILTHNYKLLLKTKRFFDEKESNEKERCKKAETVYIPVSNNLEIIKNINFSTFIPANNAKSMYYSKMKKIKNICDSSNEINDEERLYIGNYIRYVLETFNLFKRQNNSAFSNIEELLPSDLNNYSQPYNDVSITNANKDGILVNLIKIVSDEESHGNPEDFYFYENYCTKTELKETAKILMNYIYLVDSVHFKNLGL